MEYVDSLLIMKDDDDNAENYFEQSEDTTGSGGSQPPQSEPTPDQCKHGHCLNLRLKKLRRNTGTSYSYNLRSVPEPVEIPRSRIHGHASSFMAQAARLVCL